MDSTLSNAGLLAGLGMLCAAATRGLRVWNQWRSARLQQMTAWQQSLNSFQNVLADRRVEKIEQQHSAAWKGYRRFVVDKVKAEAESMVSIYLTPEDGRALPSYAPGQYLTLHIPIPGSTTPLVRCYSLSDRPRSEYFRLTVKAVGQASEYLNDKLQVGDVLHAQAPRGEYALQRNDTRPIVLIAAGIGITPVFSMLSTLLHEHAAQPVVLFYGVRNSREHAFKHTLQAWAQENPSFQYVPCYSQPLPEDRLGFDYVAQQRIDLALIQKIVPHANFPCYLCGPGSFMESIVPSLYAWGVAESDVHYEAFGPSTVKRGSESATSTSLCDTPMRVVFKKSGKTALWNASTASLLDQAEAQEIPMESGCRIGNCGMCAVKLLAGNVKYTRQPSNEIPAGKCLTCVAQPISDDLVLDI